MTLPSAVAEQSSKIDKYYETLNNPEQLAPAEEPPQEQESVEEPKEPRQDPSEDYEKRFKNYKASTDKTLYELRQQNQALQAQAERTRQLEEQLQKVQQSQPRFSKEALDTFSEEELNVFNNLLDQRTSGLVAKVGSLEQELQLAKQKLIQDENNKAHLSLKEQVQVGVGEGFSKIDTSPEFKSWLSQPNSYGKVRMDLLRQAQSMGDVERIISFYNDFKQIQTPPKVDPRELQQVPDSSGRTQAPRAQPQSSKVWDQVSIQEYYKDAGLGKYTSKQQQEIEQDIYMYLNNNRR